MTIVVRPVWEPWTVDIGEPGVVTAAVGDVIGSFGKGPWVVRYLEAEIQSDTAEPDRDAPGHAARLGTR